MTQADDEISASNETVYSAMGNTTSERDEEEKHVVDHNKVMSL